MALKTARSTSSPPSASTAPSTAPKTSPTSTSPPRLCPALHRHPQPERPAGARLGKGSRDPPHRRLPGHPLGRIRRLHHDRAARPNYDNAGHSEVYRYDAASAKLDCASCDPTNAAATGDASLASDGLSLTEDGRVFFNSTDALAPRDLDESEDVYEWEPQGTGNLQADKPYFSEATGDCIGLISTGTSPFDSSLLGVSANGTDAYFFTRDTLVPQDENGQLVKIYDARAKAASSYPRTAALQGLR